MNFEEANGNNKNHNEENKKINSNILNRNEDKINVIDDINNIKNINDENEEINSSEINKNKENNDETNLTELKNFEDKNKDNNQ